MAPDLLAALLRAVDTDEGPRLGRVDFRRAQFGGEARLDRVDFRRAQFSGEARFDRAQFSGHSSGAMFERVHFRGNAWFDGAQFSGEAWFAEAQFGGRAGFDGAQFSGQAWFREAQFSKGASFDGAQFSGPGTTWAERRTASGAMFEGVQFGGDARFEGVQFSGYAWFGQAQFSKVARFSEAQFGGDAAFDGAQFRGYAEFAGVQFSGEARFSEAQFSEDAWFAGVQFSKDAGFGRAQFSGAARFAEAQFSGAAWFDGARFSGGRLVQPGPIWFDRAQFSGHAGFNGAKFRGDAGFREAQFLEARALGPLQAGGRFSLDGASFSAPILIEAATPQLSLVGATFKEAATLRFRFAEIVLDSALFTKASTISFAEAALRTPDGQLDHQALETPKPISPRPRLLSVRLVDVSNLVLGNLDLSACLFRGAHNLEKLRIEGPLRLSLTPGAWRIRLGWWIPIWRWTRRQTLAEEHHFRAQQSSGTPAEEASRFRRPGWNPPAVRTPEWVEDATGQPVRPPSPEPAETRAPTLAALYRALRKGLEDQKNAPGAADFYYGEMEMRRQAAGAWADRFVLWVYWLFSGYGLRASRALLAFALVVPLFAIGFWLWGLDLDHGHRVSYPIALLRSFESATSLLRPPPSGLTEIGQLLDAVLRLIGATLLGLALFSLRGRIKR